MKAIDFKERTHILAEDQDEYLNLPVYIGLDESGNKQMISLHELTDEEVETIVKARRIWHSQLMHKDSQYHPTFLTVETPFIEQEVDVNEKPPVRD